MRRTLLSLVVMVLCTVLPLSAAIRFDMDSVSFEGGQIPADWAADGWVVEGGAGTSLVDPTGCAHGLYRVAARSESSLEGVTASLVTKAIDFVAAESDEPRLVFSYAAPAFTDMEAGVTYVDTLVVYYQAAANGQWTELGTFERTPGWKMEEIILPNYMSSRAYRIKFEMRHCIGSSKGVVLDNVFIYQSPKCEAPTIAKPEAWMDSLYVELTGHPGGYVPSVFDAFLSTVKNNKPDTITDLSVYAPYYVQGQYENYLEWSGLSPYTQYYLYARTNCDDNLSGLTDWSEMAFKTPKLITLPYEENFESATAFDGWYRLASQGLNGVPAIVDGGSDLSLEGNKCLFFSSATTSTSTLAAGQYACAVSPQIVASSLKNVQVSFWGAASQYVPGVTVPQLEVGVITDPEDITTFVPVATVKMDAVKQFKKFTVNFSSYTGKARYVAFRAKGTDLKNQFAIDDLKFEAVTVPVPSIPELKAVTPSSLTVEVNKFGADTWNLLLAENYYHDSIPAALISQSAIAANTATIAVPDSLQGKVVVLYAQGVKGGVAGEWSFPLTVRVPLQLADTTPQTITFPSSYPVYNVWSLVNEKKTTATVTSPVLAHFALHNTDYRPQISSSNLSLSRKENYFALGYLNNLSDKEIIFHLRGNSSNAGKVALGVMTNPYDESTFELLAEFDGEQSTSEYSECIYDLDQYTGAGHYLAFKSLASANYIQSIILDTIPTCRKVAVVNCVPGSTKATFSWEANNMSKWQIVVSKTSNFADTVANVIVTTPSYTLTDLEQEKTYYYKVNTICGADTIQMYSKKSFETALGLPFQLVLSGSTFPASLTQLSGLASAAFAGTLPTSTTSGWTVQTASSAPEGMDANLKVNIWGTDCRYWMVSRNLMMDVEPGMHARMTFDAAWTKYASKDAPIQTSTDDKFMVLISLDGGATWKPEDAFIWANDGTGNMGMVDDFSNIARQVAIDLTAYAGKIIMFAFYGESTVSGGDNDFHVANIKISSFDPNCPGVTSVEALNITETTASLNWVAQGAQEVTVQVATDNSFADSVLVYNQIVTTSPVALTALEGNTRYYVRVMQNCDPNQEYKYTKFKTTCSSFTVEQFGVVTFSEPGVLDCWKVGLDSTGTGMSVSSYDSYQPQVNTITKFGNVLELNKRQNTSYTNYGNNYYAILPQFDVDSLSKYQLRFSAGVPSAGLTTNVRTLIVGVAMNQSTATTDIDTLTIAVATDSLTMGQYVIPFDGYKGDRYGRQGKYVVLKVQADEDHSNVIYIDNVSLELVSNCHQVTQIDVKAITSDGATLTWDKADAEQFEVMVVDTLVPNIALLDSAHIAYSNIVSEKADTVTGLEPNSNYYAYVRSICGAEEFSAWSAVVALHTECAAISTFPWTEDFEGMVKGSDTSPAPTCWSLINANDGNYPYIFVNNSSSYVHSGTKSLYFQSSNTRSGIVVLPRFETPISELILSFACKFESTSSSGKLYVGYVTDANDAASFDTIAEVTRMTSWQNVKVDFVDVPAEVASDVRIAFMYGAQSLNYFLGIDDIVVDVVPACLDPKDLTVSSITTNSAVITWEGTSPVYDLCVTMGNDTVASYEGLSEDSVLVTGLLASSTYKVALQGICGSDSSDVITTMFSTNLGVPYVESMETKPAKWFYANTKASDVFNGTAMTSTDGGWTNQTSNVPEGMGANMKLNIYGTSCKYWMVTPTIDLTDSTLGQIQLSFDAAWTRYNSSLEPSATSTDDMFLVAISTDGGATWNQSNAYIWANDGTGNMGLLDEIPANATKINIDLSSYIGNSIAIGFYGESTVSGGDNDFHVANVNVREMIAGCDDPTNVAISLLGQDTAVITWSGDSAKVSVVRLAYDKDFEQIALVDTVAAGLVDTIPSLAHATTFYAQVQQICTETATTAFVKAASPIVTVCDAIESMPWSYDFASATSTEIPVCWTVIRKYNTYPSVSTASHGLYFNGGGSTSQQMVALPEFTAPVNSLTLTMLYQASVNTSYSSYGKLIVGTLDETMAESSFVALDTLDQTASKTNYELVLAAAPATAKYLAVRYALGTSDYGSAYIYNLTLDVTPTCLPLAKVETKNVERRSMDIVWTPKLPSDSYDLVISTVALSDSALNEADKISLDTTAYHVEGLTRNTVYYIYVRANCGAEDGVGAWSAISQKTAALQECYDQYFADGTATSTYFPFYGYNADYGFWTQMIYPESMMADLVGSDLSSLKFYVSNSSTGSPNEWEPAEFQIALGTTTAQEYTSVDDIVPDDALTPVYVGAVSAQNNVMTINFTTPFHYTGGSLVIDVYQTEYGTWKSVTFDGVATSVYNSFYTTDGQQMNVGMFLPKVGFEKCVDAAPCPAVDAVNVANLTASSATVNWTASDADYLGSYEVVLSDTAIVDFSAVTPQFVGIDSLSLPLTGLAEHTNYYVYVHAVCNAEGHDDGISDWNMVSFQTKADCNELENVVAAATGKTTALVNWDRSAQGDNYCYILSLEEIAVEELDAMAKTAEHLTDTFVVLSGLELDTTYYVYVANECGAGAYSPFSMASFHTGMSCPAVANLHAVTVAFNAVQLAWNHGLFGEETEWEVGLVGHEAQAQIVTDSTTLIIGLNPETDYVAYVKALCSETESSVIATLPFTSASAPSPEVQLGAGTSTAYLVYTSWGNTYSQHIYTASELQAAGNTGGTINSISFQYSGTSSSYNKEQSIYIGTTATDSYEDATADYFVSGLELVYGPEERQYQEGWVTYDLSTPFEWDGTSNIVVGVLTNQPTGINQNTSNGWNAYGTSTSPAYRTVCRYRDNIQVDPDDLVSIVNGNRSQIRPNVRFDFEVASCAKVANLKAENITTSSADVRWFPGGSETSWNTYLSTTELTEAQLATVAFDTTSNFTKHLTGLSDDVDYYFYVRAICSATDKGAWKELHFVTVAGCKTPVALHVDSLTKTSANVAWQPNPATAPTGYTVAYGQAATFDLNVDSTYQTMVVTDTVALISNLLSQTAYKVAVSSTCDATTSSRWCAPIEFTTECGIHATPWSENFEGNPNMSCWVLGDGASVANNSTYSKSGTHALEFNKQNAVVLVVLPEFADLSSLEFAYSWRCEGSGANSTMGYLEAGYVTDPNDASTFVQINNHPYHIYSYEDADMTFPSTIPAEARIAFRYSGQTSNWYLYVDDLDVHDAPDCVRPIIEVDAVTTTSATLRFESGADSWNAYLLEGADTVVTYTALDHDTLVINGLSSATTYSFFVQGVCGSDASEWGMVDFATECSIVTAFPWMENFEAYASGDFLDPCYDNVTVQAVGTNTGKLFAVSTTTNGSNITHQLQLPDQSAGTITRLYLPDMLLDSTSEHTFSLDIYRNTSYGYTNEGIRVFVKNMQTGVEEEITFISRNYTVAGNRVPAETAAGWYTYSFGLPSDGLVYSIVLQGESQYGSATYMDNLLVEAYNPNCLGVTDLEVVDATTTTADIVFHYIEGAADAVVEVSKKADFSTIVYTETLIGDTACHITGLQCSTNYYVRVKQLCGDGEESGYKLTTFSTQLGAPYRADFSEGLSADWTRYSYQVTDANPQFTIPSSSKTTSGWSVQSADTVINAAHIRGNIYGSSWKYWLVSPAINLADNQGQGLMLYVDLGLTPFSSGNRSSRNNGVDDRFMVVISEDGGATWNLKNATIWDNNEDNHLAGISQSYNDIPEHAATYRIPMTEYVGKNIAIGFYGESTLSNADNYFHFGNIKLDTVPTTPVFDTICSGSDYAGYGFEILAEDLKLGENMFSKYTPAEDSLHTDSITSLHLFVKLTPKAQEVNDTLCYGDSYTMPTGETIIATQSRRYNFTLSHAAANGCDSVMAINLFVHEKLDTTFTVLQCKGTPFEYKGKQYLTNTVIYDTVPSMVTGCDSTVTIIVEFSETEIEQTSHRELIAPNTTYSDDLFTDLSVSGTYVDTTASIYGCDSIVTLHLLVAQDEISNIYDTIYVDELPYVLNGEELLPEGTAVGRYKKEIMVGFTPFYVVIQVKDRPVVGLEFILGDKSKSVRKVMIDQHIYLIVGDEWYDTTGKHVEPVIK